MTLQISWHISLYYGSEYLPAGIRPIQKLKGLVNRIYIERKIYDFLKRPILQSKTELHRFARLIR